MTTTPNPIYDRVRAQIWEIIEPNPQRVYTSPPGLLRAGVLTCWYVQHKPITDSGIEEPGCLLGHWLSRFYGVSLGFLNQRCEGYTVIAVIARLITWAAPHDIGLTDRAVDELTEIRNNAQTCTFLHSLQVRQDHGQTWGQAYEGASRMALQASADNYPGTSS